jgi:hypothetical protein
MNLAVRRSRGTWKTRAVGSLCRVGAAKPYTIVAETPTSMLAGSPERASAECIPATEPAPHARGLPRPPKQVSSRVAYEPADEHAAGVASRVELANGLHLVLDPARGKRALHQLRHLLL